MEFDPDLLLVIPIIFMVVVVPFWLILHYATRRRTAKVLTKVDEETLAELWALSEKLERRVEALEVILDREAPGWRTRS